MKLPGTLWWSSGVWWLQVVNLGGNTDLGWPKRTNFSAFSIGWRPTTNIAPAPKNDLATPGGPWRPLATVRQISWWLNDEAANDRYERLEEAKRGALPKKWYLKKKTSRTLQGVPCLEAYR